jgi:hypothetical protein
VLTAVLSLVGVIIGALLAGFWQRRNWILDHKAAEYRGILDALSSYRHLLAEYHEWYRGNKEGVKVEEKPDAQKALARAKDAVTDAFGDRIFTFKAAEHSDAAKDWTTHKEQKLRELMPDFWERAKILDSVHEKLVKESRDDLKL